MSERSTVKIVSSGEKLDAWFYVPDKGGPHRAIVMAHGLGGIMSAGLEPFAKKFSDAGFAVLVFDYRGFGASTGEPRQFVSVRKQLQDYRAAIDYLMQQSFIDSSRIGLWGSSFSGGHVLSLSASDPRIKAVVSQVPNVDTFSSTNSIRPRSQVFKLAMLGLKDIFTKREYVPVVGEPGTLAMLTSKGALEGYNSIASKEWSPMLRASSGLGLTLYRPIVSVKKIQVPVMYVIAEQDSEAPAKYAFKAAKKTKNKEVYSYSGGHFELEEASKP